MDPLPDTDFEVGEVVHWEQQPHGKRVIRTGTIVAIIPAGTPTAEAVSNWRGAKVKRIDDYTRNFFRASRPEDEKGYLVLVIPRDPARKASLYCPDPTRLTRKWIEAERGSFTTKDGQKRYYVK